VIKVCCPSHIVVWEGSVWGALVRCPATGRLPSDRYHVVTGSVLGFPSASLFVLSQLECPVSFFGAASTSAPPYKADPRHVRHCPFWSPFTTRGSVRGWVFYPPHPRGRLMTINRETANAIFEDARNARGGERQFAVGRGLVESNLHLFEPVQLRLW
jgi:hypothetical protein